MPTYRMSAPDGQTYQIDGPEGASDEQVRAEIIKQNPHLAGEAPKPEFQAPPREGVLGAPIKRIIRGGKAVADFIYPAAPAPPKDWSQFGQDALAAGGGLLATATAFPPMAALAAGAEATRPAFEALGRATDRTPEQFQADLAAAEDSLRRAFQANDPNWIHQAQVQRDQIKAAMGMSPEERAYKTGEAGVTGAEMIGGAFLGKPFKFRGPVAAEAPAAEFLPKAMRPSLAAVPKPLAPGQQPIVDMSKLQEPPAPPAPPARQIRRPFEEAPAVIEAPPAPEPFTIPTTPEGEPMPTAAEAAQARTGGVIPPRQPEPSPILDAQGRPIMPTPEPGQGTAGLRVSPPAPETPLQPANQPSLLKEAGQIAEERAGGAVPPRVPNEPSPEAMGQEAERTIREAMGEGETPTRRLLRKKKSISGGSNAPTHVDAYGNELTPEDVDALRQQLAHDYEYLRNNPDKLEEALAKVAKPIKPAKPISGGSGLERDHVGWITPEGKFVEHSNEISHDMALTTEHGWPKTEPLRNLDAAFPQGWVRVVYHDNMLNLELAKLPDAVKNAAQIIADKGAGKQIIIDLHTPEGGFGTGGEFSRPWKAMEFLKSEAPEAFPAAASTPHNAPTLPPVYGQVDTGMQTAVNALREKGFPTVHSGSGAWNESSVGQQGRPYVAFDYSKMGSNQLGELEATMKRAGWVEDKEFFGESGTQRAWRPASMRVSSEAAILKLEKALETPTTRLIRKGKGISGGSGDFTEASWVKPGGEIVDHAPDMAHETALVKIHGMEPRGMQTNGSAFDKGWVRTYKHADGFVGVELDITNPEAVQSAIKYVTERGAGSHEIYIDATPRDKAISAQIPASSHFDRPWKALQFLRQYEETNPILQNAGDVATTPTTRLLRKGKSISGGSEGVPEGPMPSAREIGMRRATQPEEKPATFLEQQAAKHGIEYNPDETPAPAPEQGPRMLRGSANKTAITPDELAARLTTPTPSVAPAAAVPKQPGTVGRVWNKIRASLPKEIKVLKERPDSPVITEMEQHLAQTSHRMQSIIEPPSTAPESARWWSKIKDMDPEEMKQLEASAVAKFKETGDLEASIKDWPQALKDYIHHRNDALAEEQAAREIFGQKAFKELPGPYLPHITDAELDDVLRIRQGESTRLLQTTVKGAQEHRTFETMLEGEANGRRYIDPRNAILTREYNGIRETGTARMLQALERTKGIFKDAKEAAAISPTGRAYAIEGIPGADTWYTATEAEREFLKQNLIAAPRGINIPSVTSAKNFADTYMRTPNLINPYPHALKNMGAKYLLARGPVGAVEGFRDVAQYKKLVALDKAGEAVPEIYRQFREFMPYAEAEPAYGTMRSAMVGDKAPTAFSRGIKSFNAWSSKKIFQEIDPGLRYSLFKHYVETGMAPQEAANNAWIDLVRYGTRSEATDFWKSIPTNFFVPWRVGTYSSVWKAARNHPFRTALTIGAIDALREIRYRETGRWTHLPWDYIEGPISLAIEHMGKGEVGSLGWETAMNALFGPGGEQTARGISGMLSAPTEPKTAGEKAWYYAKGVGSILWGIQQIFTGGTDALKAVAERDPSKLINAVMAILVAERDTITRDKKTDRLKGVAPRRFLEAVPQRLIRTDPLVRAHELEQNK